MTRKAPPEDSEAKAAPSAEDSSPLAREARGGGQALPAPPAEGGRAEPPWDDDDLPSIPRRRRHPLMALSVIALAIVLGAMSWRELVYFFTPRTPVDLGEAAVTLAPGKPAPVGRYVTMRGFPDQRTAVKFPARWGSGFFSFFRLSGEHGGDTRIFIQRKKADGDAPLELTDRYKGRLRLFSEVRHHDVLSQFYASKLRTAIELDPKEVRKGLEAGGTAPPKLTDRKGKTLEVTPDTELWISVTFPGEYALRMPKHRFKSEGGALGAARLVNSLGVPWTQDGKPNPRSMSHEFVVHVTDEQKPAVDEKLKEANLILVKRTGTYLVPWRSLKSSKGELVVEPGKGQPRRYVAGRPEGLPAAKPGATGAADAGAAAAGGGTADGGTAANANADLPVPSLKLATSKHASRVPWNHVSSVEASVPMQVPADALLLVENEDPKSQWPMLPMFALLLAFVALNVRSLVLSWRERREEQAAHEKLMKELET